MKVIGISLLILINFVVSQKTMIEKCTTCNDLVAKFLKELKRTNKGNFGGGNTAWEETKLGKYLISETRFEEIFETLCESKDYECMKIRENHEDYLLEIFQNKQTELESILKNEFCINTVKFCCPKGTFGSECQPCSKLKWNKICSGKGNCDGDGTKGGTGDCQCNSGHTGKVCDQCKSSFFVRHQDESSIKCQRCAGICRTCSAEKTCLTCENGYVLNTEKQTCEDLNECNENPMVCGPVKKCVNKLGSYECEGDDEEDHDSTYSQEETKEFIRKKRLFKQTFIIGVTLLCGLCAYFAQQYITTFLSVSFGIFIFYMTNQ